MPKNGSYEVVEDVFTYTTKRGGMIRIDFDFPPEVLKRAMADDTASEEDQFSALAEWIDEESQKAFDGMGALERTRFYRTFFAEWQKAAELPLGESLSSSTS